MSRGIGIALRGAGKALLKGKVKPKPSYPKAKPRGKGAYPATKPKGYMRGETTAEKYKKLLGPVPKGEKAPKIPDIKKTTRDIGKYGVVAGLAYVAGKAKAKKEAKAKETKEKLKEATEKHKKKTKEKREKHGKPHA